jgi:hypothetical protein
MLFKPIADRALPEIVPGWRPSALGIVREGSESMEIEEEEQAVGGVSPEI